MGEHSVSRETLTVFAVSLIVITFFQRALLKDYYRGHAKKRTFVKRTIVVGNESLYGKFYDHLKTNDDLPIHNLGYVSIHPEKENQVKYRDCIGEVKDLEEIIKNMQLMK